MTKPKTPALDFTPLVDWKALRGEGRGVPVTANRTRLRAVLAKLAARKCEGLRLYEPLPKAAEFHECRAKYCLIEGGNRSSKTTSVLAELARAMLGCDPYDKYPKTGGVALLLGLKEDDIARLWATLSEPGAFKMIRDERTRIWRAVRPDPHDPQRLDPYDRTYREQWRDAPPLLPPRLIPRDSIAWVYAARGVPRTVKVPSTRWRLELRPSGSRPDQGEHYNLCINDEEMEKPEWFNEETRGLVGLSEKPQHKPRLLWSATAQVASRELAALREKAEAGVQGYARFVFVVDDNPYVPEDERRYLYNSYTTEEDRQTRYYGVPAISFRYIYAQYAPDGIHGCEPFTVPDDWCRYAVVDPGTTVCATLLAAVDPDEKHVWIYGGFVLRNTEQSHWAHKLLEHQGNHRWEAMVMDGQAGRQHSFANALTTADQFAQAMARVGVVPRSTGPMSGFFPGTKDLKARTIALRNWMTPRSEGPFEGLPVLQVMKGVMPELDEQIKRAISDRRDPEKRQRRDRVDNDCLDDLEYLAAFDPRYNEPERIDETEVSPAVRDFQQHFLPSGSAGLVATLG